MWTPQQSREPDLVELTRLDPTIELEIRYATTNNFLGRYPIGNVAFNALK
ncbi:MAG: hypothetical protein LC753_05500 [Acidobacteria bacterium]|nr:hypothetical protein [Acidobacteriota bacterium]MCA1649746.1 hypothetical protein [Acidobacteriota bacterium]